MKHTKKWLSLLLAVIMVAGTPLSAFAATWEDGFVIQGQGGGSEGEYDDLFWNNPKNDETIIEKDDTSSEISEEEEVEEEEEIAAEPPKEEKPHFVMEQTTGNTSVLLSENYAEIYGTDSLPKARSATESGPYDYLQANGGYVTITADKPLKNILHYDGAIVDNIHIAKWVADDPSALEYPAYCKNPGWKGTAQHEDGFYQVDPLKSISAEEKKILGVARAGYPYKTPAELGCNSVDEAYYATHGAIHTAIVNGSLDKWSVQSGDTERNTRVLNALKKIYTEGIANPYSPPAVTAKLSPVSGSEEATEEGDWIVNTYRFESNIDRDSWKFRMLGDELISLVESGSIEVYADGRKLSLQTNISGAWDTAKAFSVPMGSDVTVKVKKELADATGLNYTFYGTTVGGSLDTAVSYLGNPVSLSGNWQGYIYNFRPQATDSALMTYNASPAIPDVPEDPSGEGSLLVEKLDYNTKKNVEDAVFHIRGISDSCSHINIVVKASDGATEPILGNGAACDLSDGIVELTGIPEGVYEVTEVSAPPHYSVAVGKNSQSVEVVDDAEVHPKVIFENKPYGSLTIRKIDADTQEELAGFYFKVVNHTTGFEQTVKTGNSGEVTIEDLPEGSYEVTEIAARFDYILDDTPQISEVDWGEETTVVMKNHAKPSIEIKKIDAETSEPIEGVHFEITHKNTQQVYQGVTNEDGIIELIGVEEGWYEIEEVAPAAGYIASDKVYEVYAESGKSGTVTIKNTKRPDFLIEKRDSKTGKPLAGAMFSVEKLEAPQQGMITGSPFTTDEEGKIVLKDLLPGAYKITEIKAPNNYVTDTESRVVNLKADEDFAVTFENTEKPSLTVNKVDSITKEPLDHAVFEVYRAVNGSLNGETVKVGIYTSDANGQFKLSHAEPGWYRIVEKQAPSGYERKTESVDVFLKAGEDKEITFENSPQSAIIIKKVDAETGEALQGIKFEVRYLSSATGTEGTVIGTYTTSKNGTIVVAGLKPGVYSVAEVSTDSDHILDETMKAV